jgi:putative heme iron utilization protein
MSVKEGRSEGEGEMIRYWGKEDQNMLHIYVQRDHNERLMEWLK